LGGRERLATGSPADWSAEGSMTRPRTIAGQAALSGMPPYVKRALGQTILTIEAEATAPYLEALREADQVLADLAAQDAGSDWDPTQKAGFVKRAQAAHQLAAPLLGRAE
jgi:hypothetical protein